jgi:ABC-type glycerol-3-phosphate transport system permease component
MKSTFRGRTRRSNRSPVGTVVLFILVLISALFMLLPVLYAIGAAFKPLDEIYIFPPRLFAHNPTWKNFQEIGALADTFWVPMSRYLFNTILICSVTTLGHLLLSSLAAYPLALHNFPGKRFLNTMVKWSLLFTSAAMLLPQYVVMSKLKIINTYWAIILPAMQSSLGLYLMMNFMTQVPQGLLEAARLDGASEWRVWYQIVMPNIKPAWLTVMIFTFQAIWNTTGTTQMTQLIYDEKYKMVSSLLSQIVSGGTARAGVGSAFSLLLMLPPVILFILCQSRIIETMSNSGMK